jgi:multidrug efflux pump subunit AcrA (membrane-fusion protein)
MRYWKSNTAFLLIAVLALSGCAKREEEKKESAETIPVKVKKVELKDVSLDLEYVGNITAQDEVQVYPKVTGKIIEKVREEGSAVVKGEVIAYIDRDEVGLEFAKAPVESPLSGIVGRVFVDLGSNVNPQTPIALVVDMDKVKIDLDTPEKYLPRVSLGQEAEIAVDAYPAEEFKGKVTKMSPVVDVNTRSAPVEITVDNPGHRLKSGMFAKVRLTIQQQKNVPVVLKEAVMGKEPSGYVYVVEDNMAKLKQVTLGIRQGPYFEVREGLKEGDLVVIMGQQRLRDNTKVSTEMETQNRNQTAK